MRKAVTFQINIIFVAVIGFLNAVGIICFFIIYKNQLDAFQTAVSALVAIFTSLLGLFGLKVGEKKYTIRSLFLQPVFIIFNFIIFIGLLIAFYLQYGKLVNVELLFLGDDNFIHCPDSVITINGTNESCENGRLILKKSTGTYKYDINTELYEPYSDSFRINLLQFQHEPIPITLTPKTKSVLINVIPHHSNYLIRRIDSLNIKEYKGVTPYKEELPYGTYQIEIDKPWYKKKLDTLRIPQNEIPTTYRLVKNPYRCFIKIPPNYQMNNIDLFIDQKFIDSKYLAGNVPLIYYDDTTRNIEIHDNDSLRMATFVIHPIAGVTEVIRPVLRSHSIIYVTFFTENPRFYNAEITVDGKPSGNLLQYYGLHIPLFYGLRRVLIVKNGEEKYRREIHLPYEGDIYEIQ